MDTIYKAILLFVLSLLATLVITPFFRKLALKLNLVDKPNARKVHTEPVPLMGGIVLFFSLVLSFNLSGLFFSIPMYMKVIFGGATVLLIVGVVDDKLNLRALLKLLIQILLAFLVFESGIKIEGLFGLFGIYSIPVFYQYILTLVVIVGVINAFNLLDGIDGLALGMAILSLVFYTLVAVILVQPMLVFFYISLLGSLLGLLRFNFSKKQKIFIGDAGSLFLGFILISSGIVMIQMAQSTANISLVLSVVGGVLALPVIDSLRVYRNRLKKGRSPFKADKTHLHHLVLVLGLKHKYASLLIVGIGFFIIVISAVFGNYWGLSIAIFAIFFLFIALTSVLGLFKNISIWREKIKLLERQ